MNRGIRTRFEAAGAFIVNSALRARYLPGMVALSKGGATTKPLCRCLAGCRLWRVRKTALAKPGREKAGFKGDRGHAREAP